MLYSVVISRHPTFHSDALPSSSLPSFFSNDKPFLISTASASSRTSRSPALLKPIEHGRPEEPPKPRVNTATRHALVISSIVNPAGGGTDASGQVWHLQQHVSPVLVFFRCFHCFSSLARIVVALAANSGWDMDELSDWLGIERTTLVRNLRLFARGGFVEMACAAAANQGNFRQFSRFVLAPG